VAFQSKNRPAPPAIFRKSIVDKSRVLLLSTQSNKLRPLALRAATVAGFMADIWPAYASGAMKPLIDKVFTFDQLPAARDAMESNAQVGKIVVRING